MKSAFKIIARSRKEPTIGIVTMLETALEMLDDEGLALPAVYVDMALNSLIAHLADRSAPSEHRLCA